MVLAAAVCGWLLASGCPGPSVAPEGTPVVHERAGLGCASDLECGLDRCDSVTYPGGACVGSCGSASDCPPVDAGPAQVCLGSGSAALCLRGCESDGGCLRQGWLFQPSARGRLCLPDCTRAPQSCAGAGLECNQFLRRCETPLPADAGLFGLCGFTSNCAAPGACIALNGQDGDGGLCAPPCDANATVDAGCPASSACLVRRLNPDGGIDGLCAIPCGSVGSTAGCAPGTRCQSLPAGTRPDGGALSQLLCAP